MAGRRGLFGVSRFPIEPDRSKFDPDLHPDHAVWVPEEHGKEFFDIVKKRTAMRGSGASAATIQLHNRAGKSWVSFETAHAGIAFEWGSYAMPRQMILSSSAAKFNKKSKNPAAKAENKKKVIQLKKDSTERLKRGLRLDLNLALKGRHAADRAIADRVRLRLLRALNDATDDQALTTTLPYHLLEKIKRPFRATETKPSTRPGLKLGARLRNIESLREIEKLADRLTR